MELSWCSIFLTYLLVVWLFFNVVESDSFTSVWCWINWGISGLKFLFSEIALELNCTLSLLCEDCDGTKLD